MRIKHDISKLRGVNFNSLHVGMRLSDDVGDECVVRGFGKLQSGDDCVLLDFPSLFQEHIEWDRAYIDRTYPDGHSTLYLLQDPIDMLIEAVS